MEQANEPNRRHTERRRIAFAENLNTGLRNLRAVDIARRDHHLVQRRVVALQAYVAADPAIEMPSAPIPEAAPVPEAASEKGPSGADDIIALIRKLGELKEAGLLTEDEFASKKRELLDRL